MFEISVMVNRGYKCQIMPILIGTLHQSCPKFRCCFPLFVATLEPWYTERLESIYQLVKERIESLSMPIFQFTMLSQAIVLVLALLARVEGQAFPPVKVDLYYETLCPYSIDYFVNQLYPAWEVLSEVMEVQLFPFGNANYEALADGGWSFTCQHGDDECRGNMIHACAQKYITDFNVEMDFVYCLLSSDYPPNSGPQCASVTGVSWVPIEQCIGSVEGQEALYAVALEQEKLDPTLYFVPWIVVDDTFSEEQVEACQTDMTAVVCQRYSGPPPAACTNSTISYIRQPKHSLRSYKLQ